MHSVGGLREIAADGLGLELPEAVVKGGKGGGRDNEPDGEVHCIGGMREIAADGLGLKLPEAVSRGGGGWGGMMRTRQQKMG